MDMITDLKVSHDSLVSKLKTLCKISVFNNDLCKISKDFNKSNVNYVLNSNNNCVKMCRISTECKALDIYEDKCQYNKHFNCFWPKCRFTTEREDKLSKHIDMHLNKRQFICEKCNKGFTVISNLK